LSSLVRGLRTRIIVMTDVHANLPALQAALTDIREDGYDVIVHTGDAIAIGPYPAECMELLMNTPSLRFVMGNQESYFVQGLPKQQPSRLNDGEVEHQLWTHAQLGSGLRQTVSEWPYRLDIEEGTTKCAFMHYALDASGRGFVPIIKAPNAADLDGQHASVGASVVFYGHDHSPSDIQGSRRYVNPGALGCSKDATARYCSLEISRLGFVVEHHAAAYDRTRLFEAFEERKVPERAFIQRSFFGKDA